MTTDEIDYRGTQDVTAATFKGFDDDRVVDPETRLIDAMVISTQQFSSKGVRGLIVMELACGRRGRDISERLIQLHQHMSPLSFKRFTEVFTTLRLARERQTSQALGSK